ncbi:MAG TPA: hypothetical protein VL485_24695 [Ktedonobacteraceae bacterium]|nr:hypothetical protein [Ktedonobacteraceae bacterium]
MEQSNLRRSRYVTGRQTQVNSTIGAKPTQETPAVATRKTSSQDGARQTQINTSTGIRYTGSQNSVRQTDPAVGSRHTGSQNSVRQTDPTIGMRHTGSQNSARQTNSTTSIRQSQVPANDYYDDEYDDVYPTRTPSSARRYQGDVRLEVGRVAADVQSGRGDYVSSYAADRQRVPARRTATQTVPAVTSTQRRRTSDVNEKISNRGAEPTTQIDHHGPRFHWLVYVGIIMVVMVLGWIGLTSLTSWWQTTQDDLHYGRPRTVQVDAVVGHNDSPSNPSHFISTNIKGHIQIIEFQGGDDAKAKVYTGPVLIGQDLAVPLLSFKDVNGDHKPDMIVSIQQSRFVFINENGGFRALRPGEKVQMGN